MYLVFLFYFYLIFDTILLNNFQTFSFSVLSTICICLIVYHVNTAQEISYNTKLKLNYPSQVLYFNMPRKYHRYLFLLNQFLFLLISLFIDNKEIIESENHKYNT